WQSAYVPLNVITQFEFIDKSSTDTYNHPQTAQHNPTQRRFAVTKVSPGVNNTTVFCQISGRDISSESCSKTQGQEGCFGCAAPTRLCEKCHTNFVVVAATGTCSHCTAAEIEKEKGLELSTPPKKVECQLMKRSIAGSMCRTIEGQEGCRGCGAASR